LANQVREIRLEVEKHPGDMLLECDAWALRQAIGNLLWAGEFLGVISEHLQGRRFEDGHGYFIDSDFKYKGHTDPSQPAGIRKRMLKPGETTEARNRAEFETAVAKEPRKKARKTRPRPKAGTGRPRARRSH